MTPRQNYTQFAEWCQGLRPIVTNNSNQYHWCYKAVSGMLYDLAPIYSGYTSLAAIRKHNGRTTTMTREHYNSRTRMAHIIMEQVLAGDTVERLLPTIKQACQVHYTTKEENVALTKYQGAEDYDWKAAYEAVGIKLVRFDGVRQWHQIDGVRFYKTKKELRTIFGVGEVGLKKLIEASGEELAID